MEFEQKSIKATSSGYCVVEDGIIYEVNPIYSGQRQRIGVTDVRYNELKAISDEYYKKLVDLGAIVPPKSPEELQKETMQMMSGMLAEIRAMKAEMEVLRDERRNVGKTAGNEPTEHREIESGMGSGSEGGKRSKQSR